MRNIYKILSIILILSIVITNAGSTVYAKENVDKSAFAKKNSITVNGKSFNQVEFDRALNKASIIYINKTSVRNRGGMAAGLYFIPGVGQVLITVAGVVIVSGIVICVGSWLYNKITIYFAEHTKNKRPSTHDKHTKPRPGRETEKKKQKKDWQKRK
ncbi:MAG: hypothetical protein NC300_06315 [Bacteroidales bacterium]|nr:hypothetical protein [Clostridium sp.]MCM1203739.1 hypothetical protein [Bacteroidales bacterium]